MSKTPKAQQTQQTQQHKGRAHEAQQKEQTAQEVQHITDTAQETQEERAERVKQERTAEAAAAEHMEALRGAFISPTGEEFILVDDNREYTTDELEELFSSDDAFQTAADTVRASLENIREQVRDFMKSDDMEKITEVFPDARQWALDNCGEYSMYVMIALLSVFSYVDVLPDYLKENGLEASLAAFTAENHGDPEHPNASALDLFLSCQQKKDSAAAEKKKPPVPLDVVAKRPTYFSFPLDRINEKVWSAPEVKPDEKLRMTISTKPGHRKNPTFSYSIDWSTVESDFPIVAQLTRYDKKVCGAIGALMEAGNDIMTIEQIYHTMGHAGKMGSADRQKIEAALTKFTARIRLDNKAEREAGLKYERYVYKGDFVQFESLSGVTVNGKEVKTAIHVFRYPAVLEVAAARKQIQKIPIAVLQTGINSTPLTDTIEDYLLDRISNARRGWQPKKILWATMYEHCGISDTDRKQRKRLREYVGRFMDAYKKSEWIKSYSIEKDGVSFSF